MTDNRVSIQLSLLVLLLNAVSAQLRALDVAIKLVLQYLEDGRLPNTADEAAPPSDVPVPVDGESGDPECSHPAGARLPAQTMGHPTRFVCRMCGGTFE